MSGIEAASAIAAAGSARNITEVRTFSPKPASEPPIGAGVTIRNLTKAYGTARAIDDLSIDIVAGEFVSLLGPSGSGKTTTMMAIAGFVDRYSGEISIGGRPIDNLPAHRRNVGVLFQHLALFPHMSVVDNVAFPLRMRALPEKEILQHVDDALRLVKMTGFEDRAPGQLSGGQQQRIALARAIVFRPPILLLDEPLGALDRQLRERMQAELRALHKQLGITVIHITHDQAEALAISDRIAVINKGRLEQFGTPYELYSKPANGFVADFLGESITLRGIVDEIDGEICAIKTAGGLRLLLRPNLPVGLACPITLMLRPERILFGEEANGAPNCFPGDIRSAIFTGDRIKYVIGLESSELFTVNIPNRGRAPPLRVGQRVQIGWGSEDAIILPLSHDHGVQWIRD